MKDNPISLFHELESYVRGSKDRLHRYMYACILEQRLADLLLLSRCGVHPEDSDRLAVRLASQRSLCVQAASDIAEGTQEAWGSTPAWPDYKVAKSSVTQKRPELLSLIRVMQELRTPECSGYDLCDLEVCREDALHWLRDHADPSSPPVLIGVRTGGAFYAPLWSSALRQRWGDEAHYHTVRALRKPSDPGASLYLPEELSMLPDAIEPDTDIVILEDQPHTGGQELIGLDQSAQVQKSFHQRILDNVLRQKRFPGNRPRIPVHAGPVPPDQFPERFPLPFLRPLHQTVVIHLFPVF